MRVTLSYFGQLGAITGKAGETREVMDNAGLRELFAELAGEYGEGFRRVVLDEAGEPSASLLVLVNETMVDRSAPVTIGDGDTISLLTAIAGG